MTILESKTQWRKEVIKLPIEQKLIMLERLRDFARAMKQRREELKRLTGKWKD